MKTVKFVPVVCAFLFLGQAFAESSLDVVTCKGFLATRDKKENWEYVGHEINFTRPVVFSHNNSAPEGVAEFEVTFPGNIKVEARVGHSSDNVYGSSPELEAVVSQNNENVLIGVDRGATIDEPAEGERMVRNLRALKLGVLNPKIHNLLRQAGEAIWHFRIGNYESNAVFEKLHQEKKIEGVVVLGLFLDCESEIYRYSGPHLK